MRKSTFLAAALCSLATLLTALPAEARVHPTVNPNVNQRQAHQQHRIANGINKGNLTPRETIRLQRQQVRINRYEARNRADGRGLNRHERARLAAMQGRASAAIYRQKHDAERTRRARR
jgi:hypothetical protein